MSRNEGFSLLEVLVAMAIMVVVMLVILTAYSQGNSVKSHVQGTVEIQSNVRLAMDSISREVRMTGYGVPRGFKLGASHASWSPAIFHAGQTELGFRAEIDGGSAEIICTPDSTNMNCPLDRLRLDSIDYYEDLNCDDPGGSIGGLELIAIVDHRWDPLTCKGFTISDGSISVAKVPDLTFEAGMSGVATVEQIYYRYIPDGRPPYGSIERYVRYGNDPDDSFPPSGATWTPVADHLTDFWLEYRDAADVPLTGSTLTANQRALVRKVVLFMEGYDRVGPDGHPQLIQVRSEVLVRNLSL
jgi:prepilin-type N-terminal cleavage/methylation domain-containing protein